MWIRWEDAVLWSLLLFCPLITPVEHSSQRASKTLNVALHAQVSPDGGTVVGSVLTTDGLKAAFDLRSETSIVEVFYPYTYANFFTVRWDVIIIEGWFMMIHEFIQLARSHSPGVVVIFFCLDPTFPGLDSLLSFDVDGYMTNSRELQSYIIEKTGIPTAYVMLAADPSIMQLNSSIAKEWGAVYVGAGGGMLEHKSKLLGMLQGALPYGLRLHGSEWGNVEEMKAVWLGSLPRYDLSSAYSSAHVVLASAIDSQSDIGMINNRIFEALACGAIVISDNYTSLHEVAGSVLLMADNAEQVGKHIQFVLSNPEWAAERSKASRAFVLGRHTWSHRVVEILDFYHIVKGKQFRIKEQLPLAGIESSGVPLPQCPLGACNRHNCPKMLWVVSEELRSHSDVTFVVEKKGFEVYCGSYVIEYMSSSHPKWQQLTASLEASSSDGDECARGQDTCRNDSEIKREFKLSLEWLSQYDVLLAVITPYDRLDRSIRMLPNGNALNRHIDRAQKRAAYLIGLDPTLLPPLPPHNIEDPSGKNPMRELSFTHYDLLWYRSPYELQQLHLAGLVIDHFRMIQCFGVGSGEMGEFNGYERAFRASWGFPLVTSADTNTGNITTEDTQKDSNETQVGQDESIPGGSSSADRKVELKVVAVCFWRQAGSCTVRVRDNAMNATNQPYVLLLLGGTLTAWLDNGACRDGEDMARIVHVSTGHVGAAVELLEGAESVFIFHGASRGVSRGDGDDSVVLVNTVNDVLWPLVLAATGASHIFLSSPNPHLQGLTVASDLSSEAWTYYGMSRVLSSGMVRLHGFGVKAARVDASYVTVSDGGGVPMSDIASVPPSSPADSAVRDASPSNQVLLSSVPIILKLSFPNFSVGRDGSCCVMYQGVSLTCLIRSTKYLIVTATTDSHTPESIDIQLSVRGNMFGDEIFSLPVRLWTSFRDEERERVAGIISKPEYQDAFRLTIKA